MLVSIVIPYYNDEKNIYLSVSSALKQTYKNIEIIIIDNENSFLSKKILEKIKKKSKKIKIFRNKKLGNYAGIARNIGVSHSKGKLIAFLDSDDFWSKNKLKLQVKELEDKSADILFTNFSAINEKNKEVYKVKSPALITFKDLVKSCPVCLSSVVIKKKCFRNFKFKKLKTKEDYELWLNFSKFGYKIKTLNYLGTYYRLRASTLSSLHLNKIINAYFIYSNSLKFNFFYSIFCVIRLYFNAFLKKYLKYE